MRRAIRPRTGRALPVAASLVVALTSWPVISTPTAASIVATASRPKVTLLAAGSAPRAPLRLSLTAGTVIPGDLVLMQSIQPRIDGKPGATVSVPPITISQTTRGEYLDSSVEGTENLPASTGQLVEQIGQQTTSLAMPLPREAVGAGARWRATTVLDAGGIRVRQHFEYRLRARDGDRVTLDVALLQTAPRQRADVPGLPSSATATVTRWRLSGGGSGTLLLTGPFPTQMQTQVSGTQVFDVRQGDDSGTSSRTWRSTRRTARTAAREPEKSGLAGAGP